MTEDEPRTYWNPEPIPREWAVKALASGNSDEIANALVRLAYHDPDWRYVYDCCVRFAGHADPTVRGNAAVCLGLLAVFHKAKEIREAIPLLETLRKDADAWVVGCADDALESVELNAASTRRIR